MFFTSPDPTLQSVLTGSKFEGDNGGGSPSLLDTIDPSAPALALHDVWFVANFGSPASGILLCRRAFAATGLTFSGGGCAIGCTLRSAACGLLP